VEAENAEEFHVLVTDATASLEHCALTLQSLEFCMLHQLSCVPVMHQQLHCTVHNVH
jgi:hypothetical protein